MPGVALCAGSKCQKKGAKRLLRKAQKVLAKLGHDRPLVVTRSCRGQCKKAPLFSVERGEWIPQGTPGELKRMLKTRAQKLRKSA